MGEVRIDPSHASTVPRGPGLRADRRARCIIPLLVAVTSSTTSRVRWGYIGGALGLRFRLSASTPPSSLALTHGSRSTSAPRPDGLRHGLPGHRRPRPPRARVVGHLRHLHAGGDGGVIFVSIIGDRRMRIAIDAYAVALVGGGRLGRRSAGHRAGRSVALSTPRPSSSSPGSPPGPSDPLNRASTSGAPSHTLNEAFDERDPATPTTNADLIQEVFHRGLPLVPDLMPAERVAVFARTGGSAGSPPWPPGRTARRRAASSLASSPSWPRRCAPTRSSHGRAHSVIPIGYCADGELVMVVPTGIDERVDPRTRRSGRARWPRPSCG